MFSPGWQKTCIRGCRQELVFGRGLVLGGACRLGGFAEGSGAVGQWQCMLAVVEQSLSSAQFQLMLPVVKVWMGKKDEQFYLTVQDEGVGIDLEKFGDKLFGMYKTFHGNKDARGFGLYITRAQVEVLGGNIQVESTPGEGTLFTVSLPMAAF